MHLSRALCSPGLALASRRPRTQGSSAAVRHSSIQSKLVFGFAVITTFTLLATSVAFFSSLSLGSKLFQVETESLPPLMELLSISRQVSELSAVSANLARAESPMELKEAMIAVSAFRAAMIAKLMSSPAPAEGIIERDTLRSLIDDLSNSASLLGNSTAERIRLRLERVSLMAEAIKAHRKIYEMLASSIDNANFALTMGFRNYAQDERAQKHKEVLTALGERELPTLVALLDLRAETNLIIGILSEASLVADRVEFMPLQDRLLASTHRAKAALVALSSYPGVNDIGRALDGLLAFANGNSIMAVRYRELSAGEEGWSLVRDCRAKGERLANAAENAAARSRETVSELVAASKAEVLMYSVALALLLVSSVIVLLTAFLFIRQHITQRLNSLRSAIRTIANGDLTAAVPSDGDDELTDMATAVETFKANALKLRALEEEQFRTLAQAERAVKAKSEFLSNMSHELRTPMHAILSYAKLGFTSTGEAEPAEFETYFKNIHTAGSRFLGLLNNLLDLAKLESGKMAFNKSPGDFMEVVEHTLIEMGPLIKDKAISITTETESNNTNAVFDKHRMIQVMVNLISNAVKFSPPGANILVGISDAHLKSGEEAICCSVADGGTSVPKGELETIFDKFIQSSKTKTGAGGTGLGLAICREIVEAHSGKIWAANREPKGVVLSFMIPRNSS